MRFSPTQTQTTAHVPGDAADYTARDMAEGQADTKARHGRTQKPLVILKANADLRDQSALIPSNRQLGPKAGA